MRLEIEEEGTIKPESEHGSEVAGVGETELVRPHADEDSRVKDTKKRQVREPVSPANRGGRSREVAVKNQAESKGKRRPRTPKPEIVCWKRERECCLA